MSTTELIIVRLLPNPPTDAATFTNYLAGLTIDAYDRNIIDIDPGDAPTGTHDLPLGSATGILTIADGQLWPAVVQPLDDVTTIKNKIIQHIALDASDVLVPIGRLKAVATAVIAVNIQFPNPNNTTHHEYPKPTGSNPQAGYDIRLDIKRDGISLDAPEIEWNANYYTISDWSPFLIDYMGIAANGTPVFPGFPSLSQPSLYAIIPEKPSPLPPGTASILLSKDGTPPSFDSLLNAVNAVLDVYNLATGSKLENLTEALTEQQCDEIAHEIAYNRAWFPLPPAIPKNPPPDGNPSGIEDLYTTPSKENDQTRSQFEGNLTAYHARLNAMAMKLSKYIFAASAAIDAERTSTKSTMAQMTFPLDPVITQTQKIAAEVTVVLTSWDNSLTAPTDAPIHPNFIVPAAYFYALGYLLPTNMSGDRYKATINVDPDFLTKSIQWAVSNGVLKSSESTVAQTNNFSVNTSQAIRRLSALLPNVIPNSQPMVHAQGVRAFVERWRDNEKSDTVFWTTTEFQSAGYLNLMIDVVAGGDTTLAGFISNAALVSPPPLKNLKFAYELPRITTVIWNTFFTTGSPLPPLPEYTAPGKTEDRIKAFTRKLKQFFSVGWEAPPPHDPSAVGAVPRLDLDTTQDLLVSFIQSSSSFSFDDAWNNAQIQTDLLAFSGDEDTRRWLEQTLKELWTLVHITNFTATTPPKTTLTLPLRMSYMEALHSRGLVSANIIAALSTAQFKLATTGTVIEPNDATTIHELALTLSNDVPVSGPEPAFGFRPGNPGDLVNCIPPANLSPLGHIQYLHEMLNTKSNDVTLLTAVSARRGDIGILHATQANLETEVPEIDIVIESLEALGSREPSEADTTAPSNGAIYDTPLNPRKAIGVRENTFVKDNTLLAAIPMYSSPAVKIQNTAVYDKLKMTFSSPNLPFSRQLEISRPYLCSIGTDRFQIMRHFRRNVTEFAIDPTIDPQDFQKHVWRFPVRVDIGLEYLCISKEEQRILYGEGNARAQNVVRRELQLVDQTRENQGPDLEQLLSVLGLSYCELLCIHSSGWVVFKITPVTRSIDTVREAVAPNITPAAPVVNVAQNGTEVSSGAIEGSAPVDSVLLPECPPCCLSQWQIAFLGDSNREIFFVRLAVFIRLWRTLNSGCHGKISCSRLADICVVLKLFDSSGRINPRFIEQLPSLIMLHEIFGLPWSDNYDHDKSDDKPISTPGSSRTKILSLWDKSNPALQDWDWAVRALLHAVRTRAETEFKCHDRGSEFLKIIAYNLDPLAKLASFSDANPWNQSPTCTIRFAEVLTKIYASKFSVGEILFLFTTKDRLDGDDPFPIASRLETLDRPLSLPDGQFCNSLERLRKQLLCVEISDEECETAGWHKIESIIRDAGYSSSDGPDALLNLAEHFFPETLEHYSRKVSPSKRRYSTPLAINQTSPKIWSADPCTPFHYASNHSGHTDTEDAGELWVTIPLRDEEVFHKLQAVRQLRAGEILAVKNLYWMPRAALAPFALLFDNFGHAVERLVQEPCEKERFEFFKRQVLLFHRRCEIISAHLATHVKDAICRNGGCDCSNRSHGGYRENGNCEKTSSEDDTRLAWAILRGLVADENTASRPDVTGDPWENDGGSPPSDYAWNKSFSGGALAAILGLIGTGIKGVVESESGAQWTEMRGGLDGFGHEKNKWNIPVPGLIPKLLLPGKDNTHDLFSVKNGLAFRDRDDGHLGGVEQFTFQWTGTLIIDCAGSYVFSAGKPHAEHGEHERPDCKDCDDLKWDVTLQRGQKITLLSHSHKHSHGPAFVSQEVCLEKGTYSITVEVEQKEPNFNHEHDLERSTTGFYVEWEVPHAKGHCLAVPFCNLITNTKDGPLNASVERPDAASQFQRLQYFSSLRDIRRTYQRAFKAVLFAKKFCLDAKNRHCDMSEIQYLLDNAQQFEGTSFYLLSGDQTTESPSPGSWTAHHAWFDFNFLPVGDSYFPPDAAVDSRANSSQKRQAALFDWWERVFDYTQLREQMHYASKRPVWLLFQEANSQTSFPDLANLMRRLKTDTDLMNTLLNYAAPNNSIYTLTSSDLLDERWTTRLWLGKENIRHIAKIFYTEILENARPALWAADDLDVDITIGEYPPESGLNNLVEFVQESILSSDACASRIGVLRFLNNGIRERCRNALITYITDQGTLKQSDGKDITTARQLSDLLLQDVETQVEGSTTRILDAISATQKFVQRARIGLEAAFKITQEFSRDWECKFASYETWVAQARRHLYGENWVLWEELKALEKGSEAGCFLVDSLPTEVDNLIQPGRPIRTKAKQVLPKKALEPVQSKEMAVFDQHTESTPENLTLLSTPDYHARQTLLSVLIEGGSSHTDTIGPTHVTENAGQQLTNIAIQSTGSVPMWIQSAIRLGVHFIRVAASGRPPALPYKPTDEKVCCEACGKTHVPSIDEYYFWLQDTDAYDSKDVPQNADINTSSDDDPTAPAWDPDTQLPGILSWPNQPSVVLFWTRVHAGNLLPPRRSAEGVRLDLLPGGSSAIKLELEGRAFDSLFLTIAGRNLDAAKPIGTNAGFRYDIATDAAIVTPQIKPDTFPTSVSDELKMFSGNPWFVYFKPGKPLAPPTPFGVSLALATRLKDDCQYEDALNWLRTAYNPLERDNSWAICKKRNDLPNDRALNDVHAELIVTQEPNSTFRDSPCCSGATQKPSTLRGRAVFLAYLDTLLKWADQLSEAGFSEKSQQALIMLETMDSLLGKAPKSVEAHPNLALNAMTVNNFTPSAPPLNPGLLRLYDDVESRISILRQKSKSLRAGHCSGNASFDLQSMSGIIQPNYCLTLCPSTPCQPYRFTYIFPKALDLASAVRQLANSLIAAYERGDAEYLAALRQAHERTLLDLGTYTAQQQWRAADWDVQALGQSMQNALTRLRHYRFLLDRKNVTGEEAYQSGNQTSMNSNSGSNTNEAMAAVFNLIPDFAFGVAGMGPYQSTQIPIGQKMASMASSQAKILNTVASIASTQAGLSLTQAGWQRRNEEWQHSIDLCLIEIAQIKRQTLASERRRDIALRELNNHQRMLEHSGEVLDFMRDKFSRHSLFLFLQRETGLILKGMFNLALRSAHDAYQAFIFERAPTTFGSASPFPSAVQLWSGPFEGVNAGDRLDLALRKLERDYMSNNCRELELSKRASLRESFPKEFIELRLWGRCEIDIKEWRFDLDHPGLWMRRLKSVAVSVPCVSGAYTGVHARVRLVSSKIRTRPSVRQAPADCCKPQHIEKQHCCCNDTSDGKCEDPYLVQNFASERSSASLTATSHGQEDSGLFEANYRDERYLPFEYEGAISRWAVEMSESNNLFDFQSLADMVISLNYTAREGDNELKKKSTQMLGFGGPREGRWRAFEIRREFPDVWPKFESNGTIEHQHHHNNHHHRGSHERVSHHHDNKYNHRHGGRCTCHSCHPTPSRTPSPQQHNEFFDFPLRFHRGMFPFLAPGPPPIHVTTLCIYVVLPRLHHDDIADHDTKNEFDDTCKCSTSSSSPKKCCCPAQSRHFPIQFIPPGDESCRDTWRTVELVPHLPPPCVRFAHDSDLELVQRDREVYHCEIGDLDLPSIGAEDGRFTRGLGGGTEVYGHLRFPRSMGVVDEAWVMCGFEAVPPGGMRRGGCGRKMESLKHGDKESSAEKSKKRYFLDE